MLSALDVFNFLSENGEDTAEDSKALMNACKKAVLWLESNLKKDTDPKSEKVLWTVSAMAKYLYFLEKAGEMKSFKAGDITVSRDIKAELESRKLLLDGMLCACHDVFEDGGFCFETTQ